MPSLAAVGLSVPEAIFLAVFWFFALVATSYFSFEDVMSECRRVVPPLSAARSKPAAMLFSLRCPSRTPCAGHAHPSLQTSALQTSRADFGPVATVIDLAAAATEKVPILLAVLALSGAAWGLFKYRKAITKSMLSLVTRRRR